MIPDPRLSDFLDSNTDGNPTIQFVGFPSDEGVRINGGRPGASEAPELIFEHLLKLTPHPNHANTHIKLLKASSGMKIVSCGGDVDRDQIALGEFVGESLDAGTIPVIIGGGHETSFGHFLGYANLNKPVHILNIDAHADVREFKNGKAHSGSPFKQAVEHKSGVCKSYSVFGLNPSSVASEHLKFVQNNGVALFENELRLENLNRWVNTTNPENLMVTMDMDAVQQSDAPGVSAPNASGISKSLWLNLAFAFGKNPAVTSFDLCEVNPKFDRDNQTVKLAALTVWWFLLGAALRE